jgi:hypothetical protein
MTENGTERYEFTTIEHEHPHPRYRTPGHVSVRLQMSYDEIVAGSRIEVGRNA